MLGERDNKIFKKLKITKYNSAMTHAFQEDLSPSFFELKTIKCQSFINHLKNVTKIVIENDNDRSNH
ncbi:hypothetical protein BpHYR1_015887 [Brachionus plicatilis]|uniref:Uncharacterized protein n=1 Tax=Brachionus plicatilis TaxID=10195 RepID=A0A3M7QWG7_BRAPC|nr:hypothetical protein BpHYR1_015887 [Brachionus plicatilis]